MKKFKEISGIKTNIQLLSNVQEYIDTIEYLRGTYEIEMPWYRGVSHTKYQLIPKVYRDRLWEIHEDYEWWLCVDFENRARPFIPNHQSYSHWDWYFTMQHYGLPTRLLDWTEGALIALFYAVRKPGNTYIPSVYFLNPYWFDESVYNKKAGDGVVYNTDVKAISEEHDSRLLSYLGMRKDSPPFPVCLEPPGIDKRISAQKSVFTIHGKRIDPFRIISREKEDAQIVKIRFQTDRADYIKDQLNTMGITEGTLFPGIEGLVADLKWARGID